jgi:hypothetical protein
LIISKKGMYGHFYLTSHKSSLSKAENFVSPTDNAKSYAKEKTQSDQTT